MKIHLDLQTENLGLNTLFTQIFMLQITINCQSLCLFPYEKNLVLNRILNTNNCDN